MEVIKVNSKEASILVVTGVNHRTWVNLAAGEVVSQGDPETKEDCMPWIIRKLKQTLR